MIIMSWNIRGLGGPEKRRRIKDWVRDKRVDILLVQETKRSSLDERMVRSIWPWDLMEFMLVDAEGSAGGLLSVWNPEAFSLEDCCCTKNLILLSGTSKCFFNCVIINIHAPNDVINRRKVWETTIRLKSSFSNPWCMGGDFMR